MTKVMMTLRTLLEWSSEAELLRGMLAFAVERLMELEAGALIAARYGEKSPDRLVQCNGFRQRHSETLADTFELHIPKLGKGSYFCMFLARMSQCAPMARIISGGRFHPDSCR